MLKNYLTAVRRNLFKQKTSSLINIAGMAIAIASCLFILLYVFDQLQFDKFNKNESSICRLVSRDARTGKELSLMPGALFPKIISEIPEIENGFMISRWPKVGLSYKGKVFAEDVYFADPDIFRVLTFPLLRGNISDVFREPFSIVITPQIAKKYFGNADPIGKVFRLNNAYDFTVTGILKRVPRHSSLRPSIIVSMNSLKIIHPRYFTDMNVSDFYFYFLLHKDVSAGLMQNELNEIYSEQYGRHAGNESRLVMEPLSDVYLYAPNSEWEIVSHGNIKYVRGFAIIALLILLMASFNYTNLMIAGIKAREKEFAVRKLLGADRMNILGQFLLETVTYLFISLVLALVIVELFMSRFDQLTGKHLEMASLLQWQVILSIIMLIVFTAVTSVIYPLMIALTSDLLGRLKGGLNTSRFKPARFQFGFRQIVTGVQFVVTIFLIAGVIIIYKQLNYMLNQDLGFNKEHLLSIQNPYGKGMYGRFQEFKNETSTNPDILSISAGENVPSDNFNNYTPVWVDGEKTKYVIHAAQIAVDYNYLKSLQARFMEGRDFSRKYATDADEGVILNQAACNALGLRNPVGVRLGGINNSSGPQTVIGVVKNIHYESFKEKIPPVIYYLRDWCAENILLRLKGDNITSTMKFIEGKWEKINSGQPFIYEFLDQSYDNLYKSQERTGTVVLLFCVVAVMIACIGLFGLVSLLAQTRRKEIGIRKVLGASVPSSFLTMTREYLVIILAANIMAIPAAYYVMHCWLQDFVYRINISWWIFAAAGGIALAISLVTVSFQAIRAATANPVEALRYE